MASATLAYAQFPSTANYHHVYTLGSKDGIHPPKILNKRLAKTTLGNPDTPYGLAFPLGVGTDSHNRIWIADNGTSSIHVFDGPKGAYREIRRVPGLATLQPAGIASDHTGRIYVSDAASGNVLIFDDTGEFHRLLIPPRQGRLLNSPTAVAIADNVRTIYIADPPQKHILALNQEGETVGSIPLPAGYSAPASITMMGGFLNVMAVMQHFVQVISQTGIVRGALEWESIQYPTAFGYDPIRRRVFVANPRYSTIEVFTTDGVSIGVFGQAGDGVDQFRRVDSIYVDPMGLVYVTDSRRGKVLVFDESLPR